MQRGKNQIAKTISAVYTYVMKYISYPELTMYMKTSNGPYHSLTYVDCAVLFGGREHQHTFSSRCWCIGLYLSRESSAHYIDTVMTCVCTAVLLQLVV